MNTPIRPDHVDELNALLDAMRSGSRAPETSNEEIDGLAQVAGQFRGLADRAASAVPAPSSTFDAIWEDMMSAHVPAAPTVPETGPMTRLDDATHRVQPVPEMPRAGWRQSLVSAAILAILLAGMIAAAWSLRDGNGGGTADPGDQVRLAAPGLDAGTPEATVEGEIDFLSYIDPRECTATPVTPAEREAAMSSDNEPWEGAFGPLSQPDAADARAVALVAREFKACERYIVPESLMTDRMLAMPHLTDEARAKLDAREREVSALLTDLVPSDVFRFTEQTPTGGQSQNPFIFVPETAVEFPDGRIGIPASFLIPRNDPTWRVEPPAALMTEFDILSNETGEWMVDEQLYVCIGSCTNYINGGAQPFFDLRVNPDVETPVVRSAVPASPVATPAIDREWTDWITADECTPAQSSRIWALTDTRDYTIIGPADPEDAEAAARAARMDQACSFAMNDRPLDEYGIVTSTDESFNDRATRQQATGKAIADLYPIEDASDYFVFSDEEPEDSGNANLVFEPRHAIALEDGRIVIPGTWLIWTGDPSLIQQAPENFITQAVVMQESPDGTWAVADNLPICLGECDGIWPEISPFNSEYSSIRVPGGISVPPETSPVADDIDWAALISVEECTMTPPLDADQIAEIRRDPQGYPLPTYGPVSEPSRADADAAAHSARMLAACTYAQGETGMDELEALAAFETASYIWRYSSPHSPLEDPATREEFTEDAGRQVTRELANIAPADILLPAKDDPDFQTVVPMAYLPENTFQFPDGRIGLLPTFFIMMPELPDLPDQYFTAMYVLSDESGQWLLDDLLPICIGECSDFIDGAPWDGSNSQWADAIDEATPPATPHASSDEWWTWVTADQCVSEAFPGTDSAKRVNLDSTDHDWPERAYAPLTEPAPQDAEEVAAAARQFEACSHTTGNIGPLVSPRYFFTYFNRVGEGVFKPDWNAGIISTSHDMSDMYPMTDPNALVYITTEEPVMWANQDLVFRPLPPDQRYTTNAFIPDQAVQLADGRIAIPVASLVKEDDHESEAILTSLEHGVYVNRMLIFANQDGDWLLDEELSLCIGDCDFFWAQSRQAAMRMTAMDATPEASPVATPEE